MAYGNMQIGGGMPLGGGGLQQLMALLMRKGSMGQPGGQMPDGIGPAFMQAFGGGGMQGDPRAPLRDQMHEAAGQIQGMPQPPNGSQVPPNAMGAQPGGMDPQMLQRMLMARRQGIGLGGGAPMANQMMPPVPAPRPMQPQAQPYAYDEAGTGMSNLIARRAAMMGRR